MKSFGAKDIRNVSIIGHGGEGKTTLVEAILFNAGMIDRQCRVEDGQTTTDYDSEEIKRQISISAAMAPIEWKSNKINFIDTPGYFDFVGEVVEAVAVTESALIVVGATSGLTVGTEKAWDLCAKDKLPRMIAVNRMDAENANFNQTVDAISAKYPGAVPVQLPIMQGGAFKGYVDVLGKGAFMFDGKNLKPCDIPADLAGLAGDYYDKLVEAAAENDEELMEKYFGGEELTADELVKGIKLGIIAGSLCPILVCSALQSLGIAPLIDFMCAFAPSPADMPAKSCMDAKSDQKTKRAYDEKAPLSALVFKTLADAFVGKISLTKVVSGTMGADTSLYNANAEKGEKIGQMYIMRGKKLINVDKLAAGDIGALAKLQYTTTGNSLCENSAPVLFEEIMFPAPAISMAVTAKKSGDEDKVFAGLNRLLEEDMTFKMEKRADTGDMLISGIGEMHLDVICSKVKNKFNVEAALSDPRIPYRETIRKSAKAQGRHKKQSGGHGQFGDVWVEYEPIMGGTAEFEFVDKIVGGVVPRNFIPAVEKGLREAMNKGVLAGYPMINVRCTLYDGSFHAVDSNEMSFRMAARISYKKGCAEASPVLLEPIYKAEVRVPDEYMGDIIGDMNRRRGRIMGMNPADGGGQIVAAEVPLAEMFKYATDLRSMTQGRGDFTMTFERYEDVPGNISAKIIEQAKKDLEEEE